MASPRLGEEKLIPRDPLKWAARVEELRHLYEVERLGVVAIGARFGVTFTSVRRALKKAGIPRRRAGMERRATCCEEGCDLPVFSVRHATNGYLYGRRCRLHWIVFRMAVNHRYNDKHLGKDDEAWLRRLRQLLARVQRVNREVSQSLKPESRPAMTSPDACPR